MSEKKELRDEELDNVNGGVTYMPIQKTNMTLWQWLLNIFKKPSKSVIAINKEGIYGQSNDPNIITEDSIINDINKNDVM